MRGHTAIDMTGQRFGRLTVVGRAPNRIYVTKDGTEHRIAMWYCQCDCGSEPKVVS